MPYGGNDGHDAAHGASEGKKKARRSSGGDGAAAGKQMEVDPNASLSSTEWLDPRAKHHIAGGTCLLVS